MASACGGAGSDDASDTIPRGNVGVVETAEQAELGGKIAYGLSAETNSYNPGTAQWASSGLVVARTIFDTLTQFDDKLDIRPDLAESFSPNADYTQWTFKLRPGVLLHNSKPLTAEVIKRNQDYLKSSLITRGAYLVVKEFVVQDTHTLVVHLTEPWVTMPQAWATQIGVAGDPDWMESNESQHPIGTGPFVLDNWEVGRKMVVRKNKSYWRKDKDGVSYPYLDEINFSVITDASSRTATLASGGIDIMQNNDPLQIRDFKEKGLTGEYQVFSTSSGETAETFIMLNTAKPPFDDLDARLALAYATDKVAAIDALDATGLFIPANSAFPPGSKWYNPEVETVYPQFDQVKAKELVEKVKAKNGGKFSFVVTGTPDPTAGRALGVAREMWKEVGIEVEIESHEQATVIVEVVTGTFQAIIFQHFEAPHPVADSIFWLPEEVRPLGEFSLNFPRLQDEQIREALQKARQTPDPAEEIRQYGIVQKRQAELVPYVWVGHSQQTIVASNRLVNVLNYTLPDGHKGVEYSYGSHPLFQVWIKE